MHFATKVFLGVGTIGSLAFDIYYQELYKVFPTGMTHHRVSVEQAAKPNPPVIPANIQLAQVKTVEGEVGLSDSADDKKLNEPKGKTGKH